MKLNFRSYLDFLKPDGSFGDVTYGLVQYFIFLIFGPMKASLFADILAGIAYGIA